jgi:hypothetical protein
MSPGCFRSIRLSPVTALAMPPQVDKQQIPNTLAVTFLNDYSISEFRTVSVGAGRPQKKVLYEVTNHESQTFDITFVSGRLYAPCLRKGKGKKHFLRDRQG